MVIEATLYPRPGMCRCRRSEHRRRPACAPAPSNACAPVSARASRPSKSLAIKAVRLAPFDFFDCFSKRAHLRRPGGANPLDPSADQGSVDRQDHGGNPAFRGTRVPVHRLAELVPARACARTRCRRGSVRRRLTHGSQRFTRRHAVLAPPDKAASSTASEFSV